MLVPVWLFGPGVSSSRRQRQLKTSPEGVMVAFGTDEMIEATMQPVSINESYVVWLCSLYL